MILLALLAVAVAILALGMLIGVWLVGADERSIDLWERFQDASRDLMR